MIRMSETMRVANQARIDWLFEQIAKLAIAAAAREGGDAQQAPGNAPQSGAESASPDLHGGIA